ncbi:MULTISPECIES: hypothetical protein [unclassified Paenibacillus]|uniref:hypothetical protein n=1 Tax=unclassified Paenibacillus TaxID=185978 RepID=UPI000954C141|nr:MULTISPECIES: hypothetical protein [unclassified Paenibacillus]ASS66389.1 hypothetical protein CIC07_09660 [Paenibacillus sp. RUD330]SIQ05935.1 hypothetical protein SAMN05880555_0489 [Paenibacillus sp. RU4X]SIQ26072.1 hypothetical protein SAMN05880570_0488 [Paenibacillus sp. RU4T]
MEDMQMQLWERASPDEIREAKQLLSRYRRMIAIRKAFGEMEELSDKQQRYDAFCRKCLQEVEQAVNLILDDEVRRILEMRYIRGNPHKITILHFSGSMATSTVNRKLAKGIESIANSLKIIR